VFRTGTVTAVAAVLIGALMAAPAGAAPGNDADRIDAKSS
jgi:hypothetical protein